MGSAQAAELRRLYDELSTAYAQAAAALETETPSHSLKADAYERLMAAEAKAAIISRRIKEIRTKMGRPWT